MLSLLLKRSFSTLTTATLPVVNLTHFLNSPSSIESIKESKHLSQALYSTGSVLVKDPRVNYDDNSKFLDLFEKYFSSRSEMKAKGLSIPEMFPKNGYKTGTTPDFIEHPRDHAEFLKALTPNNSAFTPSPPNKDPKWRYLFRIGEKEKGAAASIVEPERVAPADFPEFTPIVDKWGGTLLNAVHTLAAMLETGLEIEKGSFMDKLKCGNSVCGPTGSDLSRYGKGTIFAGIHYDISFMTIHGKSKFPGLYIWLRNGEKLRVVVPDGYLLVQAGRELEYLTGGYLKSGFHEVIYDDYTEAAVQKAKEENRSLWRVSSTLFSHIRGNAILEPIKKYETEESKKLYPRTTGEEYTIKEFSYINLIEE